MNTKELLLSVLMSGPATGYDIKKIMEQDISELLDVSLSNLYPALNELAAEGLVTFEKVEQDNRPNKKVYQLTEAGRRACLDALMSGTAKHKLRSEFLFILSFAPFLPRERIEELLDNQTRESERILKDLDRRDAETGHNAGQVFAAGLGRAIVEAQLAYIRKNRGWLLQSAYESEKVAAMN